MYVAIDCGPPSAGGNLLVEYISTTYKSKAYYSCKSCYKLNNKNLDKNTTMLVRECDSSGYWNGPLPVCECKLIHICVTLCNVCVTLCYTLLLCVTLCYTVLLYYSMLHSMLHCVTLCYFVLLYVTLCYSVLLCVLSLVVQCSTLSAPEYGRVIQSSNTCGSQVSRSIY